MSQQAHRPEALSALRHRRPLVRRRHRVLAGAAVALLPGIWMAAAGGSSAHGSTVTWNVDASGTWTTASNWRDDLNVPRLPGVADDVIIDRPAGVYSITLSSGTQSINSLFSNENLTISGGTLSLAATSTVNGVLALSGGTLTGMGSLTLTGTDSWTAGAMIGAGKTSVAAGASLLLNNGSAVTFQRTLENAGLVTYAGGGGVGFAGGTVNNLAGGTFSATAGGTFANTGGTNAFNNSGTFAKSGTGTLIVNVPFNNGGAVNVSGGYLNLYGGGAQTGPFTLSGGNLGLQGTHTFSAAAPVTGTGYLSVVDGSSTFNAPVSVGVGIGGDALYVYNGATGTFNKSVTATGTTGISVGGTFVFNGTTSLAALVLGNRFPGDSGGTLGGTGDVTLAGTGSTWTGGTMSGAGKTIVPAGATLTAGWTAVNNTTETLGRVLEVGGTLSLISSTASSSYQNNVNMTGGTISVLAGGTLNLANTLGQLNVNNTSGANAINNAGTVTKVGTTAATVNVPLNNAGSVSVQQGTLTLSGGVTQLPSSTLTGGTWNVFNNSALNITTGSNITALATAASVTLDGAASSFPKINTLATNQGSLTIQNGRNFTAAGPFSNSGTLTVGPSSGFYVAGSLSNYGSVVVGPSSLVTVDQDVLISGAGSVSLSPSGQLSIGTFSGAFYDGEFGVDGGKQVNMLSGNVSARTLLVGAYSSSGTFALSGQGMVTTGSSMLGNYPGTTGTFVQSGGTHAVSNSLYVACSSGSNGTYVLSGGVVSAGDESIGVIGNGTFTQTGGTNSASDLYMATSGDFGATKGFYSLSGGTLTVNYNAYVAYSASSAASFTHSGGTCSVGLDMDVAAPSGSSGTYSLSGTGSLAVAGNVNVGGYTSSAGGAGTFAMTAGTATIAKALKVWDTAGTQLQLAGGTLSVGSIDTAGNPARFNWTAGTLSLTNTQLFTFSGTGALGSSLSLPAGKAFSTNHGVAVSSGTVGLTGGTLTANELYLGSAPGTSTMTQSAGAANVSFFDVGYRGGSASYTLSGGTLAGTVFRVGFNDIGSAATVGTFIQTGGTVTMAAASNVGSTVGVGGTGTYRLVNGQASITGLGLTVGFAGTGTVLHEGGTLTTDAIHLARGSLLDTGTYTLTGGTLMAGRVNAGGNSTSAVGTGIFNVQGGNASVTGTLKIWNTPGTQVNLSGGSLSVGSIDTSGNPTRFNWTGGTLQVPNLTLSPTGPLGSTLAIGPTQSLSISGKLTVASSAVFKTPSLATIGTVDLTGGTLLLDYTGTTPIDSVRASLLTARNGGTWTGTAGIVSSSAAGDGQFRTTIAYEEASTLLGLTGSATSSYAGFPVDATTLITKYTYYGDANMDGRINADDYALLDRSFARHQPNAHWSDGDFNYDGAIGQSDYLLIDRVYAQQSGALSPAFLAEREARFGPEYVAELVASVPEPTALGCAIAIGFLGIRRRRK